MTDVFSGIKIPDSKIAREAAELVRQHETEMLYNHSVRVFAFGAYHTDTKRFEVDGADAARECLRSHGIPEPKADLVWEAIALHTTPVIPQYTTRHIQYRRRPPEHRRL
jgi:hypothetical protein